MEKILKNKKLEEAEKFVISLAEIIEKQKQLDEYLQKQKNPRIRTVIDILGSMLAETIETEEETEFSHKTWKPKVFDPNKLKEECTDIFFFLIQLIIKLEKTDKRNIEIIEKILKEKRQIEFTPQHAMCIFQVKICIERLYCINDGYSSIDIETFVLEYYYLMNAFGYTFEDIAKEYLRKWEHNMKREDFKCQEEN